MATFGSADTENMKKLTSCCLFVVVGKVCWKACLQNIPTKTLRKFAFAPHTITKEMLFEKDGSFRLFKFEQDFFNQLTFEVEGKTAAVRMGVRHVGIDFFEMFDVF